jgi:inward rectifier potassium channel
MEADVAATADALTAADEKDLGFGSRVLQGSRARFLNPDGSFNAVRENESFLRSLNLYHEMLNAPLWVFYSVIVIIYVLTNLLFAGAYLLCGPGALHGSAASTPGQRFLEAFFFSVQTLATIGYGRLSPDGPAANSLVAIEALVGLLGVAFATGLSFARFSRPLAHILYSRQAVISPYRGGTGFMFRIINERRNQLIEVKARVTLSRMVEEGGRRIRKFEPLLLERATVLFFPLHWTLVHPIDERSPLYGATAESLREGEVEFLVLLTGTDETFSQTVHSRSSYLAEEVVVGARFKDMFVEAGDGRPRVDMRRFHELERA